MIEEIQDKSYYNQLLKENNKLLIIFLNLYYCF